MKPLSLVDGSSPHVVLLVPPLLKYLAGPLLGPAQLAGVGRSVGVPVRVIDLNADWLRIHSGSLRPQAAGSPIGDHARPAGGFGAAAAAWRSLVADAFRVDASACHKLEDPLSALWFGHDEVLAAAHQLARSPFGARAAEALGGGEPRFVGLSVMWSGQVVAALALSQLARARWPGVPIIWGGAHVTALAPEIAADARYGAWVDGFVAGYAEETFRAMLQGDPLAAPGVFKAGGGSYQRARPNDAVAPVFGSLAAYGVPQLTLPAQASRGCAFGRCTFCTYPAVEGASRPLGLQALETVVQQAAALGADVAVKDAFVTQPRLDALAERVAGRVRFAACTRLVPRLGRERLARLVHGGLATLEIGLESLDPVTLARMDKRQPVTAVEELLADASGLDLHLVLNVMFGFPGQERADASAELRHLVEVLPAQFPRARFSIEPNLFQVERRAPLSRTPERYGVELGRSWPWSTVLEWNAPAWRADFDLTRARREAA